MKIKSFRSSAAALCVSALTLILTTSNSQAGSRAFKNIFGLESASGAAHSSSSTMSRSRRGGLDDPANHDANDNRGRQPGDDRGRHHGRGR